MADRFPLIVNSISKKIEEIASGDNLDLTGNGIVIGGDTGNLKYLSSNGNTVFWGSPGDVYLTQPQTITNKTFQSCTISGSLNTLTNIPNSALLNSGITINGITVSLGGSVVTPDNNTTYSISTADSIVETEKIIRLTSGGNFGANVEDDIVIGVSAPASVPAGSKAVSLFINRSEDNLIISGHVVDDNTITTLSAPGGSAQSGAINFTSSGSSTVSMTGSTINISSVDTDTKTKIRIGTGGSYIPSDNETGNFTFIGSGATSITQASNGTTGDPEITVSSSDTVTRLRGGTTGTFTPSSTGTSSTDITISGGAGGNVSVTQSGNTILIDSIDTNTVTKLAANTETLSAGDFRFTSSGATTITTSTSGGLTTFNISSLNTDTGATLTASGGIILSSGDFRLKNYINLTGNKLLKWDTGNFQLTDSIITDDGSSVTIDGDLIVQGNQTILNTSTLQVEDNTIELRKGNNLVGSNGGIQVNRTTDSNGNVSSYKSIQWFESGGYWRSWDGSVQNRFVTDNETQVLTNKTLTSPILETPTLGIATATSINGLDITSTASAVFTVASSKTLSVQRGLTLTSDNNTSSVSVNFRQGGNVVYRSDTLAALSSTTSTQLRGLISDTTGLDRLVFQSSPNILTSITTTSTGFALINSGAQSIQFGGAATLIDIGAAGGTTNINQNLVVDEDLTVGTASSDNLICNATFDSRNADILIRGSATDPMIVGRGGSAVGSNTALGTSVLQANNSGSQNTGIGYQTLLTNNSGAGNTGYGYQALRLNDVGNANTAVGRSSMSSNQSGDNNVAIGANTLETNTGGNSNVCIGYNAGYNCTGSGNVIIGPSDSANPINDVTYSPLNQSGDRQLVIGSGTEYWIRGDSNFDLTLNNDVTVNSSLTVKGNLTVNGSTTTIKSNVVEISDKAINLASVVSVQFTCTTTSGSANITNINPTLGLIPGMEVISNTGGITVPGGTTILSISGSSATLSNPVTGSGTPTFNALGPSDTAADNGGIIVNGTTNKNFLWKNSTDAWTSSEHIDLATGKEYRINNVLIASGSQIGPSTGTFQLGAGVTTSSLTSVGTLSSLSISSSGAVVGLTITNTGTGDCLVVNDEASDTTPFKIDNAGTLYVTGNISDSNASTGTTNQVLARKAGGGIEWKGLNTLADPNTVTNAGTSTDNAIARFDSTTGKVVQDSLVTIDDNGTVSVPTGQGYSINGTSVLNATTLGSGVTASSLTSVGTLTSLTVTGAINANGGINFGDNDIAYFGDGNDLSINHDGANSYITDGGTGSLYIQGTNGVYIRKPDGLETMAGFTGDGAVELYFDNTKRFETTSTGTTVTGILTSGSISTTGGFISSATATAPGTTATTISSLPSGTYRSVEYTIKASETSNHQVTKILLIHDGTTATVDQYSNLVTNTTVATYSASISGGNIVLTATPSGGVSTSFKVSLLAQ